MKKKKKKEKENEILIYQNTLADPKGSKVKYKSVLWMMYKETFFGLPHGTTSAAVIANTGLRLNMLSGPNMYSSHLD